MVQSVEGTRSLSLELCREFEDKFLQHITSGEGSGWKIVASFEGNFPNRIKQLPLDRRFDINNVQRIVLEADGYQPYLISPEKGLRSLIKVSAAANATPGLGRYPLFKREVVAIASAALDGFKNEARKMVVALVDMESAFVPPQHFIRLRREEEVKTRSSKKANEAEQAIMNWATSPQTGGQQTGGSLKAMKDKSSQAEKEANEASALKTAGPEGEITAGCLLKENAKTNAMSRCDAEPTTKSKRKAFSPQCCCFEAESTADKAEWINKISKVIQAREDLLELLKVVIRCVRVFLMVLFDKMARRPADPEKNFDGCLKKYVAVVLCQVEKAKEDMLNQLYSLCTKHGKD
ncbi:hypothetical protein CUMW_254930 [Citrus unshiu]|uniref:Dynamin stalk domain-containing protein n=1 Tax=Citrus unshiu TaxID=55188 RepID=A0A2H5QRN8_CITUN|nr:hypothetical protein CUMW_254930 [Citrus unshiu]